MRLMPILIIAASSLLLAGCPKKATTVPESPPEAAAPRDSGAAGAGSESQVGEARDLPGAGELCFRMHECLALGVPVLQPEPFTIAVPPGLEQVVSDEPELLERLDPEAVRAVYLDCCSPRAAAQMLLAAVQARMPVASR